MTSSTKIKKSALEPSLIEVFDRHKNKDININEIGLLVEQKFTQVKDIPVI